MSEFSDKKMSLRYAQNNASPEQEPSVSPEDALLQNPNAVVQLGSGQSIFKKPVSGKVLNQLQTHPPTQQYLNNIIKETLDKMGYNPNMQYSPEDTQRFIQGIKESIVDSPLGGWLKEANPELFRG